MARRKLNRLLKKLQSRQAAFDNAKKGPHGSATRPGSMNGRKS